MTLPDRIFEAAFQQARQPAIILNELGVAALWNEAFEELFVRLAGFVPERLSMPLFDWLQARDSFPYPYYVTEVTLGRLKEAQLESSVRSASGERIWLRTTLCAIETPGQDRPARWLWCAFQDISAQKLRENDLVSAKEEAEKATITKSQFLANMSHEIRTPIQTILGMTELLEDTALDKEQQDYIRTVRFSADVLLGLINDVLDFSKIEAASWTWRLRTSTCATYCARPLSSSSWTRTRRAWKSSSTWTKPYPASCAAIRGAYGRSW